MTAQKPKLVVPHLNLLSIPTFFDKFSLSHYTPTPSFHPLYLQEKQLKLFLRLNI
jgi:hypothetical protein